MLLLKPNNKISSAFSWTSFDKLKPLFFISLPLSSSFFIKFLDAAVNLELSNAKAFFSVHLLRKIVLEIVRCSAAIE